MLVGCKKTMTVANYSEMKECFLSVNIKRWYIELGYSYVYVPPPPPPPPPKKNLPPPPKKKTTKQGENNNTVLSRITIPDI